MGQSVSRDPNESVQDLTQTQESVCDVNQRTTVVWRRSRYPDAYRTFSINQERRLRLVQALNNGTVKISARYPREHADNPTRPLSVFDVTQR